MSMHILCFLSVYCIWIDTYSKMGVERLQTIRKTPATASSGIKQAHAF